MWYSNVTIYYYHYNNYQCTSYAKLLHKFLVEEIIATIIIILEITTMQADKLPPYTGCMTPMPGKWVKHRLSIILSTSWQSFWHKISFSWRCALCWNWFKYCRKFVMLCVIITFKLTKIIFLHFSRIADVQLLVSKDKIGSNHIHKQSGLCTDRHVHAIYFW